MWKKSFLAFTVIFAIVCMQSNFTSAEYIWAMKVPVNQKYLGVFLDHTYACVGKSNNCYACSGSSITGGDPVDGGYGDGKKAKCCAQCFYVYGNNGVCHQHTNRILYAAGKTLNSCVRGYSTSTLKFGIYGDVGFSSGRWSSCKQGCGY